MPPKVGIIKTQFTDEETNSGKLFLARFPQEALAGYLPAAGPESSRGREARAAHPQGSQW